jgi:hypothetical protein
VTLLFEIRLVGMVTSKQRGAGMCGQLPRLTVSRQGCRYLLAGGINTVFGVCDTLAVTRLLLVLDPAHPKVMATAAMLVTNLVNVTFSFLVYKWLVFQSKGGYLVEYLRSLLIYLPSLAVNTVAVAPLTAAIGSLDRPVERLTNIHHGSAYAAILTLVVVTFVLSFFGHKHVSFRQTANTSA